VERLTDPVAPVTEILARVPAKQLMRVYRVADYGGSVQTFLQYVAEARGKLKRGGVLDVEVCAVYCSAACCVLCAACCVAFWFCLFT
jgi:nuclear GTP-binding protein